MNHQPEFIRGARIWMRPLLESDFNLKYFCWLNDPEVNRYSQRRPFPATWKSMTSYSQNLENNPHQGFVLAILADHEHIGNIALVNLQLVHRCAEIAILIGDKNYWNQGLAAEAIYLVSKHAFLEMNLHRVFAGTFNPAFMRCVEKLGWVREGEFRERIWSGGRYHHQVWLGMLRSEFKIFPEYAAAEDKTA
ncbi:MAG: GNAT family protein [Pseudomonadota bacterium]